MSANDGDAHAIRSADTTDAESIGQLLHDFNREFDEPTPSPSVVADRVRLLLGAGDTTILLGGTGPDGLAVMRFRAALGAMPSSAIWQSSTCFPTCVVRDWAEPSWSRPWTMPEVAVRTLWTWVPARTIPSPENSTRASASPTEKATRRAHHVRLRARPVMRACPGLARTDLSPWSYRCPGLPRAMSGAEPRARAGPAGQHRVSRDEHERGDGLHAEAAGQCRDSSALTLTNLTRPTSSWARCSSAGLTMRQGAPWSPDVHQNGGGRRRHHVGEGVVAGLGDPGKGRLALGAPGRSRGRPWDPILGPQLAHCATVDPGLIGPNRAGWVPSPRWYPSRASD